MDALWRTSTLLLAAGGLAVIAYLYRRLRQVERTHERLKRALDAAEVGVFDVDLTTGRIRWSKYHELLFGFPEGTFDGTKESFRARLHPEDRERVLAELRAARASGGPYEMETRVALPDGTERWILARGRHYLERGRAVRGTGTVMDITELKRLQTVLGAARERAEESSRAKSAFIANVSHELRTPLAAILGFAEMLPLIGRDRTTELSDRIRRNGEHLLRIIDELLDLSRVEAGKLGTVRERVDVPALLAEVVGMLQDRSRRKAVVVRVGRADPRLAGVWTDPQRLRQILVNVVGNALKFTERGTITVDAALEDGPDGRPRAAVRVTDTGAGIAQDAQVRIFKPFEQADGSVARAKGGTGLGLYLSRRMAEALGGDLALERSAPGEGSVFRLTFDPRAPEATTAAAPAARQVAETRARLEGVRVLVADDMEDLRELMCDVLDAAGAAVDTAADGIEAVEKARGGTHDVVLMDMQMPRLDGYEATRRLRALGYAKPILALSAHAMAGERERSRKAGCDDHLAKPVAAPALVAAIAARCARGGGDALRPR